MKKLDIVELIREELSFRMDLIKEVTTKTSLPKSFAEFRRFLVDRLVEAGAPQDFIEEIRDENTKRCSVVEAIFASWYEIESDIHTYGGDYKWPSDASEYISEALTNVVSEYNEVYDENIVIDDMIKNIVNQLTAVDV